MKISIAAYLFLFLLFLPCFTAVAAQTQLGDDIFGAKANDRLGTSVAISADGSTMVVGQPGSADSDDTSRVLIYFRSGEEWLLDLTVSDPLRRNLGSSVAVSADGNVVVMGATATSSDELSYAFAIRVNLVAGWDRLGQTIFATDATETIGCSVDISDDGRTLAYAKCFNGGYVRVMELEGNTWVPRGDDLAGGVAHQRSVVLSASGDRVAIGSPWTNAFTGEVSVFDYVINRWQQVGTTLSGLVEGDNFGRSVDLSDDGKRMIIGIPDAEGGRGAALVMGETNGNWSRVGDALAGASAGEEFGTAVDISGNGRVLAVGAPFTGNRAGRTIVFEERNTDWRTATIIDGADNEILGRAQALSRDGTRILVGSETNDASGMNAGKATLYQLDEVTALPVFTVSDRTVFPNPTSGLVQLSGATQNITAAMLTDVSGRVLLQLTDGVGEVDLTDLAAGIYFLRWREDEQYYRARVIRR